MNALALFKFMRKATRRYIRKGFSTDFMVQTQREHTIHVLGNGPSLNKSLSLIKPGDDLIMVNFSILTDLFFELQPKYYCLADPVFFGNIGDKIANRKVSRVLKDLMQVDWPLAVILPSDVNQGFMNLSNDQISYLSVNTVPLDYSVRMLRWWLYEKNLSMPVLQNVIVMGIYAALQMGYKKVFLHGVDSDSYKNICINHQNEMVLQETHYYGTKYRNLNEEAYHSFTSGRLYRRLECAAITFRSYLDLAEYADHLGASVYNASPRSMIDSFPRCEHEDEILGEEQL